MYTRPASIITAVNAGRNLLVGLERKGAGDNTEGDEQNTGEASAEDAARGESGAGGGA